MTPPLPLDPFKREQIRRAINQAAVSREDLVNNTSVDAWILACWDLLDEVDRLCPADVEPKPDLEERDWEIIRLMANGLFRYQIALKVGLKGDAFSRRCGVIYARTGTRTPPQLAAKAVRNRWIP